jgi:hypothetical protein
MKGLVFAAAAVLLLGVRTANAAEITRVTSGFEAGDQFPIGVDLQVSYERLQHRALINRENHQSIQGQPDIVDVAELRLTQVQQNLPIRLAIGIWHDLELHATLPIVLSYTRTYGYPSITDDSTSTVANNCVTARGGYDCATAGHFYDPNAEVHRSGVGDLTIGTAFAVLSEKRDDTKPTWVVGFDYTYPLANAIDPSLATDPSNPGAVGSKVQQFEPYMAMSKRIAAIDPYLKVSATLPHLLGGFYSNCDTPSKLAFPENCGVDDWTRQATGEKPPYTGTLVFGAEFYAYDEPAKHQSLVIDLRGTGQYVSEGRYYNEMSDQLGKLLYTEQYFHVGGTFGINARAAQYVELRLAASYFRDTDHFLTNENVGVDRDGNGKVDLPPTPNALDTTGELNPNYDFRWDGVGRRFRVGQVNDFYFSATGVLTF